MALLKKWIQKGSEKEISSKKEGSSGSTRSTETIPAPLLSPSRSGADSPTAHSPSTASTRAPLKPSSSFRTPEEKAEGATTTDAEIRERQQIEKALLEDGCLVYSGTKGEPKVKGGTLDALVKRLTATKNADPSFTVDFLLTYRSFTTPRELLTLLSGRFNLDPPTGTANVDEWRKNTLSPIRLKVAAVIKSWLTNHWHDFEADESLLTATSSFLEQMAREGMKTSADAAKSVIERKRQERVEGGKEVRKQFSAPPPAPILTPALLSCMSISGLISMTNTNAAPALQVVDLDPLETARQMALLDQELFCAIRPFELLKQAWTKADAAQRAPNILKAIERFNQITSWVATEILVLADSSARLRVMAHFIDVCQYLSELNDMFATMAVIAGFGQAPIFRLKEEPLLSKKHQQKLQAVRDLMSREKSFANYRNHTHTVSPPLVPYLGAHLTDLVFLEDGNKDELDGNPQLINFDKRYMISKIIRELQTFQNTPYCLEPVPYMADYLRHSRAYDDATLHELSSKILPRTTSVKTAGRLEISGSSGNLTASSATLSSSGERTEGSSGGSKPGSRIGGRPDMAPASSSTSTLTVTSVTSPITSPSVSPRPNMLSRNTNDGMSSSPSTQPQPSSFASVRAVTPAVPGASTATRTSHSTTVGSGRTVSPQRIELQQSAPAFYESQRQTNNSGAGDRAAVRQALCDLLAKDPSAILALFREDIHSEVTRNASSATRGPSDGNSKKLSAQMAEFQTEVDAKADEVLTSIGEAGKVLRP